MPAFRARLRPVPAPTEADCASEIDALVQCAPPASRARCSAITSSARAERAPGLHRARARARRRTRRGLLGRRSAAEPSSSASHDAGLFEGRAASAPACARTGCGSAIATAPSSPSTTPITSRRSSRTSTCTCSARAITTASTTSSARTRACATASPARASRCGRRMPSASASSGRSTSGTAASTRCRCAARPGIWELFVPGRRARHGLQVRDPHARRAHAAQVRSRTASRCSCDPTTAPSSPSLDGHEWQDDAGWRRAAARTTPTRPINIYEVHPGSWRRALRPRPAVPELARAGRRADSVRPRPGLHARRADGRRRASVRRLVGLPGRRLLRADGALRHRRRTSCTSSIAATRPASA